MEKRSTAFILMCVLVCVWGLDYVFAKSALDILAPMNLLFLRYVVGAAVIFILKMISDRKFALRRKDLLLFVLCAITGEIIYFGCEYTAMDYMPVSLITIVLAFVPGVSIIAERIFFKKKFTAKMMIGVLICILGIVIVVGADFRMLFQGRAIGYLLAFGAVISWNCYNFITASVSQHYSSLTMSFNQLVCTILLVGPYAIYTMPPLETFTINVVGGVLYLGIISAGIGFLIMVNSLKVLGPTISAMFSNFLPVTATFFGWLFMGESIGIMQVIGGAIVIASSCIVITEKGKMEEQLDDRETEPDNVD